MSHVFAGAKGEGCAPHLRPAVLTRRALRRRSSGSRSGVREEWQAGRSSTPYVRPARCQTARCRQNVFGAGTTGAQQRSLLCPYRLVSGARRASAAASAANGDRCGAHYGARRRGAPVARRGLASAGIFDARRLSNCYRRRHRRHPPPGGGAAGLYAGPCNRRDGHALCSGADDTECDR